MIYIALFFMICIFLLILAVGLLLMGEHFRNKYPDSTFSKWWNSNVITEYSVDPEFTEKELEALRISNFINFVKEECEKNGVEFQSSEGRYVELSEDIKCGGYFDDGASGGSAVLAFAGGHRDFLELLAHEYSHMTQWSDGIELWKKAGHSLEALHSWLEGQEVEDIEKHIDIARDLELDNEMRTVEVIKRWNLPIDVESYIKKSNAYVHFYNYLKVSRKWSEPDNSPYTNEEILKEMSTNFDMDYETLSPRLLEIFKKENI